MAVRMTPGDASRLLPQNRQTLLPKRLVERRRLVPLQDSNTALVQYCYSGVIRHEGKLMHRLTTQSKVVGSEGAELFETRFIFDDKGDKVQILN